MLLKFESDILSHTKFRSLQTGKKQYGRHAAIFKIILLKINGILPIPTRNMLLKISLHIQSQPKCGKWNATSSIHLHECLDSIEAITSVLNTPYT